jgi:Leucine-rich repeat (LRR) protein
LNGIIYLFINDNLLRYVNYNQFNNLRVIDISDNPIEEIDNLPNLLEELVCNNCKLKLICPNKSVKKLHCQDNLMEEISYYECLEDLRCDNNKISYLQSLPQLKKISCTANPIEKIDLQKNLVVLDCSDTPLSGSIDFAPLLRNLICTNTKISDISNLKEIFEIEFYDSDIQELPYLPKLKSIIFGNTNIKISPQYKIKKYLEYTGKIDIVFE